MSGYVRRKRTLEERVSRLEERIERLRDEVDEHEHKVGKAVIPERQVGY